MKLEYASLVWAPMFCRVTGPPTRLTLGCMTCELVMAPTAITDGALPGELIRLKPGSIQL